MLFMGHTQNLELKLSSTFNLSCGRKGNRHELTRQCSLVTQLTKHLTDIHPLDVVHLIKLLCICQPQKMVYLKPGLQ